MMGDFVIKVSAWLRLVAFAATGTIAFVFKK